MVSAASSVVVNIFLVETIDDCLSFSFLFELKYFTFLVSEGAQQLCRSLGVTLQQYKYRTLEVCYCVCVCCCVVVVIPYAVCVGTYLSIHC